MQVYLGVIAMGGIAHRQRQPLHVLPAPAGGGAVDLLEYVLRVAAGRDGHELVAAGPVDLADGLEHGHQALGRSGQQLVAGHVAPGIVGLLQPVHVHGEYHKAVVQRPFLVRLHVGVVAAPVVQARQLVRHGDLNQLLFLLLLLVDVLDRADQLPVVGRGYPAQAVPGHHHDRRLDGKAAHAPGEVLKRAVKVHPQARVIGRHQPHRQRHHAVIEHNGDAEYLEVTEHQADQRHHEPGDVDADVRAVHQDQQAVHGQKRDHCRPQGRASPAHHRVVCARERQHQQRHDDAHRVADAVEYPGAQGHHQQRPDQYRKPEKLVQDPVDPPLVRRQERLVVHDARLKQHIVALTPAGMTLWQRFLHSPVLLCWNPHAHMSGTTG